MIQGASRWRARARYLSGRPEMIRQPLTFDAVTPDFFRVLRIPLLRGRYFSHGDRADDPRIAIVNETTARAHWPHDDPLRTKSTAPREPDEGTRGTRREAAMITQRWR